MTGNPHGLSNREWRFVLEYVVDMNAKAAAIRAGYSAKSAKKIGWEVLRRDDVQAALGDAKREVAKQAGLDAQWVLSRLRQVVERCMQAEEVVERDGTPTGEYQFDSSGANKALELLGKHLELFTEKVKTEHTFEDMSDADLDNRERELDRQLAQAAHRGEGGAAAPAAPA